MAINKSISINPVTRIQIFRIFVIIILGCLCIRLWFLQCLYGNYYRDKSENNRIRTVKLVAPRGRVLDRNGAILVSSRPSYNIGIMLEDVNDPSYSLAEVAKISGVDPGIIFDNFKQNKASRRFEPRIILEDISVEQFTKLKANSYKLPGITFDILPTRNYPYNKTAAQIFGYVREITKQQKEELEKDNYKLGDVIGQTGLEKSYEDTLRGYSGFIQLEVDAKGIRKQELGSIPYVTGRDIELSLDIDLQLEAENALGEYSGAVVALDPNNGEVLVLASAPTYDANSFSGQILTKEWQKISNDISRPMVNRGISNTYPLGSTSKLIWAVAGLQENVITPNSLTHCPGFYRLGNGKYLCNKKSGHGALDLKTAITVSCNAYFYILGQNLGIERMSNYLDLFGFGQKTGIDLLGEESGTSPNPKWKFNRFKKKWYPGDTVPVSIGQGYFVATPIQLAQMAMVIANGGKIYQPKLLRSKSVQSNNSLMEFIDPILKHDLVKDGKLSSNVLATVKEISGSVVENERGTAKAARLPGIRVGGKTGTAQVVRRGMESSTKNAKDHAWFVAYAPLDNPKIVIAAVVENSGHGGEFAAPVVQKIMYKYFDKLGMIDHKQEIQTNLSKLKVKELSEESKPHSVLQNTLMEEDKIEKEIEVPLQGQGNEIENEYMEEEENP